MDQIVAQQTAALRRTNDVIDTGDDVRSRMQFLVGQNQSIVAQTQFADAKAAALMTLIGLVAIRGPVPPAINPADPLAVLFFGFTAISILCCLWAVMPRYPRAQVCAEILQQDKYSWVSVGSAGWSPTRHAEFGQEADLRELISSISCSNVGGARVLLKKFRAMRLAFLAAICALMMLGAKIAV